MKLIDPVFYKFPPEGFKDWFQPGYKSDYARQHPVAYIVIGIIAMLLLFLPLIPLVCIYIVLSRSGNEPLGPAVGLSCLGCVFVGFGPCNLALAFAHEYLGHVVTLLSVCAGLLMLFISYILIFL